ncbi:MAG: M23 family metallopeptidase [Acidothermus sp.]|nr:M23 family metallopeptidase [Acidothermus sp.]MCL6538325.1 M23 family metallopeptidase [Acidothermus sp.]
MPATYVFASSRLRRVAAGSCAALIGAIVASAHRPHSNGLTAHVTATAAVAAVATRDVPTRASRGAARTASLPATTSADLLASADFDATVSRDGLATGQPASHVAAMLGVLDLPDPAPDDDQLPLPDEPQPPSDSPDEPPPPEQQAVTPPPSSPAWVRPNWGPLTSPFGRRWGRMHQGIDLAGGYGSPILAATNGTVIYAGPAPGYGRLVKIADADGTQTWYGHMSRILVHVGEKVHAGQEIALVGAAGDATGPHLHFEIRVGGIPVNPIPFLAARGVRI